MRQTDMVHIILIFTVFLTFIAAIPAEDAYDEYGFEVKDRRYLDSWSNAVYIPRPDQPLPRSGSVAKWSFYARRTGTIYLQIWRKLSSIRYKLIGQEKYSVSRSGVQNVTSESLEAEKGDFIGFYFPRNSIVPFDGEECYSRRGLYHKRYSISALATGRYYYFSKQKAGWNPCREYSLKVYLAQVNETTRYEQILGSTPRNREYLDAAEDSWKGVIWIPDPTSKVSINFGKVTKWQMYTKKNGTLYLQIWRPEGNGSFLLVGSKRIQVDGPGYHEYDSRQNPIYPVMAGDVIGMFMTKENIIPYNARYSRSACRDSWYYLKNASHVLRQTYGQSIKFASARRLFGPCRQYSLQAIIEKGEEYNTTTTRPTSAAVTFTTTVTQPSTNSSVNSTTSEDDYDDYGFEVKNRRYLDSWSNAVYIPRPDQPLPRSGSVAKWSFYARRTGTIYLQIWRKLSSTRYKLIGQEEYSVSQPGVQNVTSRNRIEAAKGNFVGFYFPRNSIIPFDGEECNSRRGLYHKRLFRTAMTTGIYYYFSQQKAGWNPCREYSLKVFLAKETREEYNATTARPTSAAVTFTTAVTQSSTNSTVNSTTSEDDYDDYGFEVKNRRYLDSWSNAVYIPRPDQPLPRSGSVAKWSFYARRTGTIYLQIWRKLSSTRYKLIGQEEYSVSQPGVQNVTSRSRIEAAKGNFVGFYFPRNSIIPFDGEECNSRRGLYHKRLFRTAMTTGIYYYFSQQKAGWNPCREYSLKVFLAKEIQEYNTTTTRPTSVAVTFTTAVTQPSTNSTVNSTTFEDDYDDYGFEVKNRRYLDSWSNAIYIPRPDQPLPRSGSVAKWSFYARRTGTIYLQIWRKLSSTRYKLIGQEEYSVIRPGVQNVTSRSRIEAAKGNFIGFYFPRNSIIPFDGEECNSRRGLYHIRLFRTAMTTGINYHFSQLRAGLYSCREYSLKVYLAKEIREEYNTTTARPTSAAVTFTTTVTQSSTNSTVNSTISEGDYDDYGFEVKNRRYLDSWSNAVYIPRPDQALPRSGSVAKWSFYARRAGTIYLQIWRRMSSIRYKLIGQKKYLVRQPGVQNVTSESQIEAEKGDFIGFYFPGNSIIPFDGEECYSRRGLWHKRPFKMALLIGEHYYFAKHSTGSNPCREYSLKVYLAKEIREEYNTTTTRPTSAAVTFTTTVTQPSTVSTVNSTTLEGNYNGYGFEVKNRRYLDSWSNAVYIPRPDQPLPRSGPVAKWSFYARRAGTIYLQIWRKLKSPRYKLIGQEKYLVKQPGVQNVTSESQIEAEKGDFIGFYFPGNSIIPFDGEECSSRRGLYHKRSLRTALTTGRYYHFFQQRAGWNPCREYSLKVYLAKEIPIAEKYDEFGFEVKHRQYMDSLRGAVYIPRPDQPLPRSGSAAMWSFYARHTGLIYLLIWRKRSYSYRLIAQERFTVSHTGVQNVTLKTPVEVEKGDVIGFYFPRNSIIPYDGEECYSHRGLYFKKSSTLPLNKGSYYSFRTQEAGLKPCREYSLKVHLVKKNERDLDVTEYGNDVKNRRYMDEWSNAMYIPNPKSPLPKPGIVKKWRFYARRAGEIYFQIWRRVSSSRYRLIGQTRYHVNGTGTKLLIPSNQVRVQKGDVVGFYFPGMSIIPFDGSECYTRRGLYVKSPIRSRVTPGITHTFRTKQSGWNPCRHYSLKVGIGSGGSGVYNSTTVPPSTTIVVPTTSTTLRPTTNSTSTSQVGQEFGYEVKYRYDLDKWSNAMYIPNPKSPLPKSGVVINWKFYARKSGDIYFQIWRKESGYSRYRLVGQTPYKVESTGVHIVQPSNQIRVQQGDVIGFYFPGNSIIPFDGRECYSLRTLYVKSPTRSRVTPGAVYSFRTKHSGWNPCRYYSLKVRIGDVPPSETIKEVGHKTIPRHDMDKWRSSMYIPEPFKPLTPGQVIGWRIYAARAGEIFLQIWRPTGSYLQYRLVGQTEYDVSKSGLQEISLNNEIEVKKGDVIGFFFPGQSIIPFDGEECYSRRTVYVKSPSRTAVKIGSTFTFKRKIGGWNPCRKYSIVAQIRGAVEEVESGSGSGDDKDNDGDNSGEEDTTTRPVTYTTTTSTPTTTYTTTTQQTTTPVFCPYPGRIRHGRVYLIAKYGKYRYEPYVKNVRHNDTIEYQCDTEYKLRGPGRATCVHGRWSPSALPECVAGNTSCCFKEYGGEAVIGTVLNVLMASSKQCEKTCCSYKECKSFSTGEAAGSAFCVLQSTSREDGVPRKKDPKFNHYEKGRCS